MAPPAAPLHAPIKLFQAAADHGMSVAIEHLCREVILERHQTLKLREIISECKSRMFNDKRDTRLEESLNTAGALGIAPDRIVIELTEYQPLTIMPSWLTLCTTLSSYGLSNRHRRFRGRFFKPSSVVGTET